MKRYSQGFAHVLLLLALVLAIPVVVYAAKNFNLDFRGRASGDLEQCNPTEKKSCENKCKGKGDSDPDFCDKFPEKRHAECTGYVCDKLAAKQCSCVCGCVPDPTVKDAGKFTGKDAGGAGTTECGSQTCSKTQVCCFDGCKPASEGCGKSSCKKSEPGKPVCTAPKNSNLVPPNHDLFRDDKIKFYWYFDSTKWNDCCSSSECKDRRSFDVWVYKDCSSPNAPTAGSSLSFWGDKHTSFWNRDRPWRSGSSSATLRRAPVSTIGWLLSTNYCWKVGVTSGRLGGGDRENSSDLCYFTINPTSTPKPTNP